MEPTKAMNQFTDSDKVNQMNRVLTQNLRELGLAEKDPLIAFLRKNGPDVNILQFAYSDQELIEILPLCPNLRCLNLAFNDQITDVGLQVVADKLPNLKSINLRMCSRITDAGIRAIYAKNPDIGFGVAGCEQLTLFPRHVIADY